MNRFIIVIISVLILILPCPAFAAAGMVEEHYGWISLLPPIIAIAIALVFRQVIPSLIFGIWIGAWSLYGFTAGGALQAVLDIGQRYLLEALADEGHAAVILFTMFIGGTVAIVSKNGGIKGVVDAIVSWISNRRRAQMGTVALGLAIFFDDYANSIIVGNTMRPVIDRLKVSREKLAYLVDSTAAPLACIAIITTWVGFLVGLIEDNISSLDPDAEPVLMYFASLPYSFYPILALVFVGIVTWTGRDFGPMLTAERRAVEGKNEHSDDIKVDEEFAIKKGVTTQARNAIIPISVMVLGVFFGLYYTGTTAIAEAAEITVSSATISDIVGAADSYKALVWASFAGTVVAIVMSISSKTLSLEESVDAWLSGAKTMVTACAILLLAWSMAAVTAELGTAKYLVEFLDGQLPFQMLPAVVFVLAALTAFSTGTSWGAMGILMPLVLPLAYALITKDGAIDQSQLHIVYSSIACVLSGAVWGDHCSPISDTTILSSVASGCNHIEHVRTQMPYALVVGAVAFGTGTIPSAFGVPWWVCLIMGSLFLYAVMRFVGRRAEDSLNVTC